MKPTATTPAGSRPPRSLETKPSSPAPAPAGPAWLIALQETQQQTAEAHRAFLMAMTDSHLAFLQVSESAIETITRLAGGLVARPAASETTLLGPAAAAPRPSSAPPALAPFPPALPPLPSAPRLSPQAPSPELGISQTLLQIVADKTGFPIEMLRLDMDLEGDLGIDSIKRVEILSALQEQHPALPELDGAELGGVHRLDALVSRLGALLESSPGSTVMQG